MLRKLAVALFVTLVAAAPAAADSITYTDTFEAGDVFMSDAVATECVGTSGTPDTLAPSDPCKTLSFTQQLIGYSKPPDELISATLTLFLRDDRGGSDGEEFFSLTGDLASLFTTPSTPNVNSNYGIVSVFAQVLDDGVVNLILTATEGDFWFEKAVLSGTWLENSDNEEPLPTPEPASLLLLGMGAIGIAYTVRKTKTS
jgi:hypothetical protein